MKSNGKLIGAGVLSAIAASLCCITPVLALISGTTGIASTFSWLEPARPYFIGITVLILGFAWYQKLKPKKNYMKCDCETEKPLFWQSKFYLAIITIFAGLMLAFPYYAKVFYPNPEKEVVIVSSDAVNKTEFAISGMTCESCELHVKHEVDKLEGIIHSDVSYKNGTALVEYDTIRTSANEIIKVINSTGYKVESSKIIK